jgi:hypothetical protein
LYSPVFTFGANANEIVFGLVTKEPEKVNGIDIDTIRRPDQYH